MRTASLALLLASCRLAAPGVCREPTRWGSFTVPAHAAYTHWTFAAPRAESVEVDVTLHDDPGSDVGLYFSLLNTSIDGAQFYLGLQTNLARPGVGWVGKGLLFSTWGTFDAADTRAAPGGYIELGTHEGKFAGVRLAYPWTTGDYRVRLSRGEGDAQGDWFELYITDARTRAETFIGALRFRRADPSRPATLVPSSITFLEVYSGATRYGDVATWHVDLMPRADGALPVSARSEYPAYPTAEFPNTDVFFAREPSRVHLAIGAKTERCHPPTTFTLSAL